MRKSKEVSLKGYWFARPEAEDQAEFLRLHKVKKTLDVAGNGNDVFSATNVKVDKLNPKGKDEKEYKKANEETLVELSKKTLNKYADKAFLSSVDADIEGDKRKKAKRTAGLNLAVSKIHPPKTPKVLATEDTEELDELSFELVNSYRKKANAQNKKKFNRKRFKNSILAFNKMASRGVKVPATIEYGRIRVRTPGQNEEVEINELSKKTLSGYVASAKDNLTYHSNAWDRLANSPSFSKGEEKSFDKHDKEAGKRYKGLKIARKKIYSEESEINELSNHKLRQYVNKAARDIANKSRDATREYHNDKDGVMFGRNKKFNKAADAGARREMGINMATAKMSPETAIVKVPGGRYRPMKAGKSVLKNEEALDELSKNTLGSYIKKASEDRAAKGRAYARGQGLRLGALRKITRRRQGIVKAVDKLTKESLNEDCSMEIYQKYQNSAVASLKEIASFLKQHQHALSGANYVDTWSIKDVSRQLENLSDQVRQMADSAKTDKKYRDKHNAIFSRS